MDRCYPPPCALGPSSAAPSTVRLASRIGDRRAWLSTMCTAPRFSAMPGPQRVSASMLAITLSWGSNYVRLVCASWDSLGPARCAVLVCYLAYSHPRIFYFISVLLGLTPDRRPPSSGTLCLLVGITWAGQECRSCVLLALLGSRHFLIFFRIDFAVCPRFLGFVALSAPAESRTSIAT